MDNLQPLNAQDVGYPGPADFYVVNLSVNSYNSLLVTGLKFISFPLKLKGGIRGAIDLPLSYSRQATQLFKQLAIILSSDITLWPSFRFSISSVCLFALIWSLIDFHCTFEVKRFSESCFV